MPFGNMDSDKIEARKGLLETFLKVEACLATLRLLLCPEWVCFPYWRVHKAPLIHSSQQLCAIPEIANSEEMQEFLALNTDARIAFVKKPFIVSRIDKVCISNRTPSSCQEGSKWTNYERALQAFDIYIFFITFRL